MHPRIAELLEYLDAQTIILKDAYESVPAGARGVRPEAGRWSAAEVVHHLAIVERRLAQRLAGLIEQARALPPEPDSTSILDGTIATRALNRTQRFVTSELSEPRDTNVDRAWDDYLEARAALIRVILTADGVALGAVSAPHPALGQLNGYDWIAFAGAHAARHADQIREDASG